MSTGVFPLKQSSTLVLDGNPSAMQFARRCRGFIASWPLADKANYIHPAAMDLFLDLVNRFAESRIAYYGEPGHSSTFEAQPNSSKWKARKLIKNGTRVYREGIAVSTSGSSTRTLCQLYHNDPPKDPEGRCLLCFPDLPRLEPKQGAHAFLTWEAYLNSFQREDVLTVMNQATEESPAAPGLPNPLDTAGMIDAEDSSPNFLGLETVSESDIPSMWRAFSSIFTPKRSRGDSTR